MAGQFDHKGFARWMQSEAMPKAGIASQSELGRRLEIAQTTISRWFSGERTPTYEHIVALARVLGVGHRAIYEAAGLVPVRTPEELADILAIWETLTEEERDTLADIGRVLVRRRLAEEGRAAPGGDDSGATAPE